MSGFVSFMGSCAIILLLGALAISLWPGLTARLNPPQRRRLIHLRMLCPPALIGVAVLTASLLPQSQDVRMSLTGMSVSLDKERSTLDRYRAFVVAGAPREADLVVGGLSGPVIDLCLSALGSLQDGMTDCTETTDRIASAQPAGTHALAILRNSLSGTPHLVARTVPDGLAVTGAVAVNDGTALCPGDCDMATNWRQFEDARLVGGNRPPQLLYDPQDGLLTRIRKALRPNGPLKSSHLVEDGQGRPALLLYQQGGFGGGQWWMVALRPEARFRVTPNTMPRALPQVAGLPLDGTRSRIAILKVTRDRLVDIRTLTLESDAQSTTGAIARIRLDTPALAVTDRTNLKRGTLIWARNSDEPDALTYGLVGERRDGNGGALLARTSVTAEFASDRCVPLAQSPCILARSGPLHGALMLRVDSMEAPWFLAILSLCVALFLLLVSRQAWDGQHSDAIFHLLLQLLIVMRMIVAISGAYADSSFDWRDGCAEAASALVAFPLILAALRPASLFNAWTAIACLLFGAAAIAAIAMWRGQIDDTDRIVAAAAGSLLLIRLIGARSSWITKPWAVCARRTSALFSRLKDDHESMPAERAGLIMPLVLLGLLVLIRFALAIVGFRERIPGIPLSLLHTPLLLLLTASLFARVERMPADQRNRHAPGYWLIFVVGLGLLGLLVSDIGYAIVMAIPLAGFGLWRCSQWRPATSEARKDKRDPVARWRTFLPWRAPALLGASLFLALWAAVPFSPLLLGQPSATLERLGLAATDPSTWFAASITGVANNEHYLRLHAMVAPEQVIMTGNREASILIEQVADLQQMTEKALGHGYLTPVELGSFANQQLHMTDYSTAVHLMFPFGRLGAFGLIAALIAGCAAIVHGNSRLRQPAGTLPLAGTLALWTLCSTCLYMSLAMVRLVPFTGRNFYFLSPISTGDLWEGFALLLLGWWGLCRWTGSKGGFP